MNPDITEFNPESMNPENYISEKTLSNNSETNFFELMNYFFTFRNDKLCNPDFESEAYKNVI